MTHITNIHQQLQQAQDLLAVTTTDANSRPATHVRGCENQTTERICNNEMFLM